MKKAAIRQQAFKLYCEGKQLNEIAAELAVSPGTVGKWKAAGNWNERRETVTLVANQQAALVERLQKQVHTQQALLSRLAANALDINLTLDALQTFQEVLPTGP